MPQRTFGTEPRQTDLHYRRSCVVRPIRLIIAHSMLNNSIVYPKAWFFASSAVWEFYEVPLYKLILYNIFITQTTTSVILTTRELINLLERRLFSHVHWIIVIHKAFSFFLHTKKFVFAFPSFLNKEISCSLWHSHRMVRMLRYFRRCPFKHIFLRMPLNTIYGIMVSWK